jgi:hypothetical protein
MLSQSHLRRLRMETQGCEHVPHAACMCAHEIHARVWQFSTSPVSACRTLQLLTNFTIFIFFLRCSKAHLFGGYPALITFWALPVYSFLR